MRVATYLAALLVLAACGNDRTQLAQALQSSLTSRISGERAQQPPPVPEDLRRSLTPQVIAQIPGPVMFVGLPNRRIGSVMVPWLENRGVTTWRTAENISVIEENGMLRGTRGLGDDLMTADIEEPYAAIRRRGGEAVRIHRFLDGENQTVIRAFRCTYGTEAAEGPNTVVETCYSKDLKVRNTYVLGRGGRIVKSLQWASPLIGYVELERLK